MYRNFKSVIQVFIRIIFWSIWWQEKYLNFLLVLIQPGCGKLAMLNFQIAQDQEHLRLTFESQPTNSRGLSALERPGSKKERRQPPPLLPLSLTACVRSLLGVALFSYIFSMV